MLLKLIKSTIFSFIVIFFMSSYAVAASAIVWEENFDSYAIGTTSGSAVDLNNIQVPWDTSTLGYGWLSVQDNPNSDVAGNYWMEAGGRNILGYWVTDEISITGYSDVAVSMDIAQTGNMEWWQDGMALFYSITENQNDNRFWNLFDFEVGSFGEATAEISGLSGNYLSLAVVMKNTWGETHGFDNVKVTAATVPVPTSILLLGSGIVGLIGFRRKSNK